MKKILIIILLTQLYSDIPDRRVVAEWEPALGTMISWPLGIPSDLVIELANQDILYVLIELNIYFTVDSECSRCLKISTNDKETLIKEKIYLKNENDYDIDFKEETIDVHPIISEKIIDNISLINLCKIDCNGLCVICGLEQNTTVCKHEEKNLKESPFSSLSELDL